MALVGFNSYLTHAVVLASNHNAVKKPQFDSSDTDWLKEVLYNLI